MANQNDKSYVPVSVPVIIEKERFDRIGVRRAARAPRNTPPLHVTPKTLLTGLCRCGYCKSSMHISTGKSGRYRYLKCNRRNTISGSICGSPNVPYERFEKLLVRSIVGRVLTESRVASILEDCRSHAERISSTQGTERRQVADAKAQVERKLKNLYKLVEDEKVKIDSSLAERIQAWQDELKELTVKLNSIKVPVSLPKNILDSINIATFQEAATALLENTDSDDAKAFIHLIVDEIRIYADEVTVSGPNLGLLEAALSHRKASQSTVPSFMSNWRGLRDSNPGCLSACRFSSSLHFT